MSPFKIVAFLHLVLGASIVVAESETYFDDILKEVTTDNGKHNFVDDIANLVVNKIGLAVQVIGANGILDPAKLQEYITSKVSTGSEWFNHQAGSLYNRIRDKVSNWWINKRPKDGTLRINQEELTEEVKKEVLKKIIQKIEEELKAKNIVGIDEKDIEQKILPVIQKIFGDLFEFQV